jgi:hypothetical protein
VGCLLVRGHDQLDRMRDKLSEHATAEETVKAVTRSPWARRLGARASSRVHWPVKAGKVAGGAL